jgi:hypothetical protein
MKGFLLLLETGDELHFPNAEHWKLKDGTLKLKTAQYGDKIAMFNWSNIVAVHSSDDLEVDNWRSNV